MPLSPEEQRRLDELEADLLLSDPSFVATMRGVRPPELDRPRAWSSAGTIVAGLTLLVAGMSLHPAVTVLAQLIMLWGALSFVATWRRSRADRHTAEAVPEAHRRDDVVAVVRPPADDDRTLARMDLWRRHLRSHEADRPAS